MPYDADGNFIADLPEILRRRRLQNPLNASPDPNLATPLQMQGNDNAMSAKYLPQPMPEAPPDQNPALSAYRQQLEQMPLRSEAKPSRLRSILGTMATVATRDPGWGEQVKYGGTGGFNDQMVNFNQRLAQRRMQAGIEQQQIGREQGRDLNVARIGELGARAGAENMRARNQQNLAKRYYAGTEEQKLRELQIQHPQIPKDPITIWWSDRLGRFLRGNKDTGEVSVTHFADPEKVQTPEEKQKAQAERDRILHDYRMEERRLTGSMAQERQDTRPVTEKGEDPNKRKAAEITAARELRESNPDYAEFVDKAGNVTPPSKPFFGNAFQSDVNPQSESVYNNFVKEHKALTQEIIEGAKAPKFRLPNSSTSPTGTSKYKVEKFTERK